jgi:predicted nucleic acid-binding protein
MVDAWDRLTDCLAIFPLILPAAGAIERARVPHTEDGWSFWDAMIAAACLECGVTRLYSEDLPGRAVRWPLEIVNPFLQLR